MFSNKKYNIVSLRHHTAQVFNAYEPSDEFFKNELAPVLAEIVAAMNTGRFRSLEDVENFMASFDALASFQRALLSAQILASSSDVIGRAGALGYYFVSLVGSSGASAAHQSAQDICQSKDAGRVHIISTALDVFWRHQEPPYREFERAQSTYLRGCLEFAVFRHRDKFIHLLREAIEVLTMVNPSLEENQVRREFLIKSKAKLQVEWQQDLERFG